MKPFVLVAALAAGCSSSPAGPPEVGCDGCVVLQDAIVFDGVRAGTGTVVLRGATIDSVTLGPVRATRGEVIPLDGKTILPGLFDLHVHTPAPSGPYGFNPATDEVPPHLKAMLRNGVTSFLDLGSSARLIFEYRARLRDGRLDGPNMFAAGPLLTPTGGHPCYRGEPAGDSCAFIDAPGDLTDALARLLPQHPDVIKLVIESGTATFSLPRMTTASMAAIAQASQSTGVPAIAHISRVADVTDALDAGLRRFAHVPYDQPISDELALRMASLGVIVVPTLAVHDGFYRLAAGTLDELKRPDISDDIPDDVLAALNDPQQLGVFATPGYAARILVDRNTAVDNVRRLHAAGVTLACGTDAGNPATFAGLAVARELELYVEAGLSPVEALTTATSNAAQLIARDDLGRLAPGAQADVLIVDGDATADVTILRHPLRVYHLGKRVDREALALPKMTSLEQTPTTNRAAGQACLATHDCAAGLACGWDNACASGCSVSLDCDNGSVCFPWQNDLFCHAGDGCSPAQQNCANGTACVWWGHGSTECWYAGTARAGQPCPTGACVVGARCDYNNNVCIQMCDPQHPQCPAGKSCIDRSLQAGVPIGDCL